MPVETTNILICGAHWCIVVRMKEVFVTLEEEEDKFLSALHDPDGGIKVDELLRSAALHWADCLNSEADRNGGETETGSGNGNTEAQ